MVAIRHSNDDDGVDSVSIPGVRIHYCDDLLPEDVTTMGGLPITTPARTLLDLATCVTDADLEYAVSTALRRSLTSRAELAATIARHPRHKGRRRLQAMLDRHPPVEP